MSGTPRSSSTGSPAATLAGEEVAVRLDNHSVLEAASVRVAAGELVGLVGPNGSGKTTLLRALLGVLPLHGGRVLLDDRPIADWPADARARRVAYVPQGGVCHWPLDVRAIVTLGRLPHAGPLGRVRRAEDGAAIAAAMEAMQVTQLADRPVTEISGGERMRVMVARALAADPALLLADEPTASLDPYHQLHTLELLADLAARGRGVLVVLHDLTLAARFCHRIVLLDRGRSQVDGAPAMTLAPARLAEAFNIAEWPGRDRTGPVLFPWQRVPPGSA